MKKSAEEIILVKDWLKFAKENLLLAYSGMREEFAPYHTICFLCQGSAEKYLKGFLIWNGWKLRKIHDLLDLLTHCVGFDAEFENYKEECLLLNEYITEGRYPGDLPFESVTEKDAAAAIESAKKIEEIVLRKIDLPPEDESGQLSVEGKDAPVGLDD